MRGKRCREEDGLEVEIRVNVNPPVVEPGFEFLTLRQNTRFAFIARTRSLSGPLKMRR